MEITNLDKKIEIGDNSWIGSRCTFLKGSQIMSNTIVASNSIVTKKFNLENIIIGGNPSKILKQNIKWQK